MPDTLTLMLAFDFRRFRRSNADACMALLPAYAILSDPTSRASAIRSSAMPTRARSTKRFDESTVFAPLTPPREPPAFAISPVAHQR